MMLGGELEGRAIYLAGWELYLLLERRVILVSRILHLHRILVDRLLHRLSVDDIMTDIEKRGRSNSNHVNYQEDDRRSMSKINNDWESSRSRYGGIT